MLEDRRSCSPNFDMMSQGWQAVRATLRCPWYAYGVQAESIKASCVLRHRNHKVVRCRATGPLERGR